MPDKGDVIFVVIFILFWACILAGGIWDQNRHRYKHRKVDVLYVESVPGGDYHVTARFSDKDEVYDLYVTRSFMVYRWEYPSEEVPMPFDAHKSLVEQINEAKPRDPGD